MQDSFDFRGFFPKEYTVKEISSSPEALTLDLESTSTHAPCPKCGFSSYRIHGKGDGVLRKAIIDELKRKYSNCRYQDASFQEYGFGATMVTIK